MRRDVRRRHPAARLFPAMKGVLLAAAFPPGEQAGRRLVVPEPAQIVPCLVRLAEREPLVRLGDIEIGPERFIFQAVFVVVRSLATVGEFFLKRLLIRNHPGRIQATDVSAFVIGFRCIERFPPRLFQVRCAIAPPVRLRRFLQALGQLRRAPQAAVTHRVDEQDRALPVHSAGDEAVLGRVANKVEVVAIGVRRNNRAETGFAQRPGGRKHFENQSGLALDVRPEPAVKVLVARKSGDFFERPKREAGAVRFGTEPTEEIVLGKRPAKLFRRFELSGAGERDDGIRAVTQPVERIIVRVGGPRLVVHQAHHQMRDLRVQAVGELRIGQVQFEASQH